MEIRALEYKQDFTDDLLLFISESELATYTWPTENLKVLAEAQDFSGKSGEIVTLSLLAADTGNVQKVIIVGVGKAEELKLEAVRKNLGKALKAAEKMKIECLTVAPWSVKELDLVDVARAITEATLLSTYNFNRHLSEKKEQKLKSLQLAYQKTQEVEVIQGLKLGLTLGQTTNFARDLVNEPANVLTPEQLAKEAQRAGEEFGFKVEVFEEATIKELGMTAFLEVGKASANRPRLIVMRHEGNPKQPEQILGLVGKGLTFDSGGYSIKPAAGMGNMKSDMGGSAAVIGAMGAIAKENLPLNVVAVVAACENLISGEGYRPGDIIGSMAGKTIQIDSTDAEGRLTLADAVHYIITKEKVEAVVDVATLTGAVVVALGDVTTGVVTNNQELYGKLEAASEQSGERVWQLPNFPEYKEQNKTAHADLKNTGGRGAGSITAGQFIEAFVQDTPWLHLDIAGTAYSSKNGPYLSEGATGVAVRLLYHFAESYA